MSRETLRFIHAANLSIDQPLRVWGEMPSDVRPIIENAATQAFRNVVAACLDRNVDFLLLAGDTFDPSEHSLPARIALRDGLSALAQANIRVFAMAGKPDAPFGWSSIPDLPQNVTVFSQDDEQPVAVIQEGKVVATVTPMPFSARSASEGSPQRSGPSHSAQRRPFTIALDTHSTPEARLEGSCTPNTTIGPNDVSSPAPNDPQNGLSADLTESEIEYVALGNSDIRRTITTRAGVAHQPGSTQGLCCRQTGPFGCTLVETRTEGAVQCTFVPTAPVRWEKVDEQVEEQTDADALIRSLAERLQHQQRDAASEAWLIRARLTGSGPLLESLGEDAIRQEFVEKLNRHTSAELGLPCAYWLRLLPDRSAVDAVQSRDPLSVTYFETIDREQPINASVLKQYLHSAGIKDAAWLDRLESLAGELDTEAIAGQARSLGIGWFGCRAESPPT